MSQLFISVAMSIKAINIKLTVIVDISGLMRHCNHKNIISLYAATVLGILLFCSREMLLVQVCEVPEYIC